MSKFTNSSGGSSSQSALSALRGGGSAVSQLTQLRGASGYSYITPPSSVVSSNSIGSLSPEQLRSLQRHNRQAADTVSPKSSVSQFSGVDHSSRIQGAVYGTPVSIDGQRYYRTHAPNGGMIVVPPNTTITSNWNPLEFYPFSTEGDKSVTQRRS